MGTSEAPVAFACFICGWELIRNFLANKKWNEAYWAERRGRTRVEMEMRRMTQHTLQTANGFFVQPVGYIESCYRQCVGTPRQVIIEALFFFSCCIQFNFLSL